MSASAGRCPRRKDSRGPALWLAGVVALALGAWAAASPALHASRNPNPASGPTLARVPAQALPSGQATAKAGQAAARKTVAAHRVRPSGYWVRVGPTRDPRVLHRTAQRLAERYGVVGRVRTARAVVGYRVLSGPVRLRSSADERRRLLAASGLVAQLREQPGGEFVLDFGTFREAEAADQMARAVRARGFVARVATVQVPEYTLTVGPVPERVALAVARTLRETGADPSLARVP